MPTKKKRSRLIILIVLLVFLWWYNTLTIKIDKITIQDQRINDEIVICQITDLHGYSFSHDNQRLLHKVRAQHPDLIMVTGDMYTFGDEKGEEIAFDLLVELTDIAPVYYVNGEHDSEETFSDKLSENGIHVFNYQDEIMHIKNTFIHLYGINNLYYSPTFDLHHEWENSPEYFSILLAHIPNFDKFKEFGIDLSLCGDTHGGQIRLPFIGALYTDKGWFPDLNHQYVKGLYENNQHYLYISSGLGSSPIPFRLFNRPEISVITLSPSY